MVSCNTNLQESFLSRLQRYSIFLKYANKNRFLGDFFVKGSGFLAGGTARTKQMAGTQEYPNDIRDNKHR